MKRFIVHLTVAVTTFLLGVIAAYASTYIQSLESETSLITVEVPPCRRLSLLI